MKAYIENVLKGLTGGILSAFLIIYALRPSVPYPEIILEIFENIWMFLILLIINYYVFIWDYHSGAILMLCVIALVFDYIVFTQKGFKKVVKVESFRNSIQKEQEPSDVEAAETEQTEATEATEAGKTEKAEQPQQPEDNSIIKKLLDMKKLKLDARAITTGNPLPFF